MENTAYFLTKLKDRQQVEMVSYSKFKPSISQSWGSNHYVLQTQEVRVYISIYFLLYFNQNVYIYIVCIHTEFEVLYLLIGWEFMHVVTTSHCQSSQMAKLLVRIKVLAVYDCFTGLT